MKLFTRVAAAAVMVVMAAACAPAPEATPFLECSTLTGSLGISPGLTDTPDAQTYDIDDTTAIDDCTDSSGAGITGGTIESASLLFPEATCTEVGVAAGSGLIRWSDGSVSAFTSRAQPIGGGLVRVNVNVRAGAFDGARGSVDVTVIPTAGDCTAGITAEDLIGGPLTLSL